MSERRTCETCRWWDRFNTRGDCHRKAPRRSPAGYCEWPTTALYDWCGEHQPREVADE